MNELLPLETGSPAPLPAVVAAITRLSAFSEAQILELISAGKLHEIFPFLPASPEALPPDTVGEDALVAASAMPWSRERRAALIQTSMPSSVTRTAPDLSPIQEILSDR